MIYLDNAATTKVDYRVYEAMLPYLKDQYGNASSPYKFGSENSKAIEKSRAQIASLINANPREIYFTSCGSESDNWAIKGITDRYVAIGKHIITSKIEHHAVLNTCEFLKKHGYSITYLDVDENGMVDLNQLDNAIRPETVLISIMFANNEIGTIEPIKKIGDIANANNVLFHTDAVQAFGHVPIDVNEMHIDLLSASGHKIGAPKGIGMLYVRRGINISPLIHGGQQEFGMRAGTENVASIIGFGEAARIASNYHGKKYCDYVSKIRDYFVYHVITEIPDTRLNGDLSNRLPGNANICFKGVEGESLLIMLDLDGICASSGSACDTKSINPSHVLKAIGMSDEDAHSSLRFTFSDSNTMDEVKYVIERLKKHVNDLKSMN